MHIPQPGEHYYHYKHDPIRGENDYRYEIVAVAWDTEFDELSVIYKPLYEAELLKENGATYFVQRATRFMEEVVGSDGIKHARFVKVKDDKISSR